MSQAYSRTCYATDEDIALRCGADFSLLCPADQIVAAGTDGEFSPTDPWTLVSPSNDFASRGALPGHVVQLLKPTTQFRPPGTYLVVATTTASGIQLRRKGQVAGIGQPPSPPSGLIGVEFLITSFQPQLQRASLELDRRFGIDPSIPGRASSDVHDLTPLRDATVLLVLSQQYEALTRTSNDAESSAAKVKALRSELDELLARLSLGWIRGDGPITRFNTRLER